MRVRLQFAMLSLWMFFSSATAQALVSFEKLQSMLDLKDWPTYSDLIQIAGEVPSSDHPAFEGIQLPSDQSILKSARIIVDLEVFNSGAYWALLGRDSRRVGDILEAFAIQNHQPERVIRLNASRETFQASPDSYEKLIASSGLVSSDGVPIYPFVVMDSTNWTSNSQSYRLMKAALRGVPPQELRNVHRTHNFLAFKASTNQVIEGKDQVDQYFETVLLSNQVPTSILKTEDSLSYLVPGKNGEICWHGKYGRLICSESGSWSGTPGKASSASDRLYILATMAKYYEVVSSKKFQEAIAEYEANLGVKVARGVRSFERLRMTDQIAMTSPHEYLDQFEESPSFLERERLIAVFRKNASEWRKDPSLVRRLRDLETPMRFSFTALMIPQSLELLEAVTDWVSFVRTVKESKVLSEEERLQALVDLSLNSGAFLDLNPSIDELDLFLSHLPVEQRQVVATSAFMKEYPHRPRKLSQLLAQMQALSKLAMHLPNDVLHKRLDSFFKNKTSEKRYKRVLEYTPYALKPKVLEYLVSQYEKQNQEPKKLLRNLKFLNEVGVSEGRIAGFLGKKMSSFISGASFDECLTLISWLSRFSGTSRTPIWNQLSRATDLVLEKHLTETSVLQQARELGESSEEVFVSKIQKIWQAGAVPLRINDFLEKRFLVLWLSYQFSIEQFNSLIRVSGESHSFHKRVWQKVVSSKPSDQEYSTLIPIPKDQRERVEERFLSNYFDSRRLKKVKDGLRKAFGSEVRPWRLYRDRSPTLVGS